MKIVRIVTGALLATSMAFGVQSYGINCAFADSPPVKSVIIDKSNYKDFVRSGLHLFPGQIVECKKVDAYPVDDGQHVSSAISLVSADRHSALRAGPEGTHGAIVVEHGGVLPFYGLWALSALKRDSDSKIQVFVDQPATTDGNTRVVDAGAIK